MCPKQIEYNGIVFRLVPFHGQDTHPITGTAFYVNDGHGGVVGLRRYPNGRNVLVNATPNNKGYSYVHSKSEYLQLKNAWGQHTHIYASHAVYLAWVGPIQPGMTIDHINGCTTDNRPENLRQVSIEINQRDGGFARKLTNKGFDTMRIDRVLLLRYFDRMAKIKLSVITKNRYNHLTREDLRVALYEPADSLCFAHFERYKKRKLAKCLNDKIND